MNDDEGDEESEDNEAPLTAAPNLAPETTIESAANLACTTEVASALSKQLVAEINCMVPNSLVVLPQHEHVEVDSAVFPYLQPAAAKSFAAAVDAYVASKGGGADVKVKLNSALRTLPQQYMLSQWAARKRCGIAKAAKPGGSKHESGLALDVANWSDAKKSLTDHNLTWFGRSDTVHFTFNGAGATDIKSQSVKAFQRLWNKNHPQDRLPENGQYGPDTEKRVKGSPVGGFAKGAECAVSP